MSNEEEEVNDDENINEVVNEVETEEPKPKGTALTINIQSWATPVVGVIMLVLGLLAGYFIRPLLSSSQPATPAPIAAAPSTSVPGAAAVSPDTTQPANLQELMAYLLPQVKHFKGDPEAAVTLIEFGDFQ
jgi:hypothetical protein